MSAEREGERENFVARVCISLHTPHLTPTLAPDPSFFHFSPQKNPSGRWIDFATVANEEFSVQ